MSTSELSKCVPANDSNIPLPKRIHTGTKKPKGCAQLPELQKYINSIIKAKKERDLEDTAESEKEKILKERKLGRNTVLKGRDNKAKHENVNVDLNLNRRKIKNKPKTPFSEAVSSGVEIPNKFLSEFEDPRNWEFDKYQNLGPGLEIENFLKKIYPNPYQLASVNENQTVKSDSILNKVSADDLGEGTLPDVDISEVDNKIESVIEKTNIIDADTEIKLNERNPFRNNSPRALSLEATRPSSRIGNPYENSENEERDIFNTNSAKQFSRSKSSNSTSNVSSRVSSLESLNEILKECSTNSRKRKNFKSTVTVSSSGSFHGVSDSQPLTMKTHVSDENPGDSDIGKLKLLNVSDSDDSEKKLSEIKKSDSDLINDASSEMCEEMLKSSDLNELLQIYDIMNKATESFLLLSGKKDIKQQERGVKFTKKDKKFIDVFSSLKEEEKEVLLKQDDCQANSKPEENCETKVGENSTKQILKEEPKETGGKSLLNLLLEEEKEPYTFKRKLDERSVDQTETISGEAEEENYGKASVNLNDSKEKLDDVDSGSNQKIDEVLQFTCHSIKEFSVKDKPLNDEKNIFIPEDKSQDKKTKSPKKFLKGVAPLSEKPKASKSTKKSGFHSVTENTSTSTLFSKTFPISKEMRRFSSMWNESKKPILRPRCKRRSETLAQLEKKIIQSSSSYQTSVGGAENLAGVVDAPCVPYPDFIVASDQSYIQTVESLNELGGYTEETQEPPLACDKNLRIAKSILPLPLKIKKTKTCAYKTLKDVLETEEKLLAGEINLKESAAETKTEEENKNSIVCQSANQCESGSGAISLMKTFKPQSSNFVICLNSFNKNLRTVAAIRPKVSLPLSISMTDVKSWNLRPLPFYSKSFLKKISLPSESKHFTLKFAYLFKQETLLRLNKTAVAYTAMTVFMKVITRIAKPQEEFLMKVSQCTIEKLQINQSAESSVPETGTQTQTTCKSNLKSLSKSVIDLKTEDKPISSVMEAIEEAEERVSLLENSSAENYHSFGSCSESEALKNEAPDNESGKEIDKKKVQDLLLRTFNLQQKLHKYLHKMTYVQPTPLSCPLIQQEPFVDFGFFVQNKTDSDIYASERDVKPENSLPLVHWYLQPPVTYVKPKTVEALTMKIQKSDQGTIYNPPSQDTNCKTSDERATKKEGSEDDEDDKSSVYSFKSSNDFSEINEFSNEPKETSTRVANGEFIKNIFNKIDTFKKTFEKNKPETEEKHNSEISLPDICQEKKENRLVEYDSKIPAKVLKTVFKGRKSLTELTIGLKDIPLTKVNNISVEKTKFSPNHTKISICISKENPNERRRHRSTDNDVLHDEFSSYYFDSIRPTLSTCQTEYTRLEDDTSKSTGSLDEGSEDEEDYKSVGSTVHNSDAEADNDEKTKPKEQKPNSPAERSLPKNFTKHKFDFYRKMDMNFDKNKPKQKTLSSSLCRYKELEPLKQALTQLQFRMRSIQKEALINSADYYDRALKLAKMSAGYCQSCGTRAVIPKDTFGYYKTLLHRRYTHHRRNRQFRTTITPNSSFYSFRSSMAEFGDRFCDLDIKHSSSYLLNRTSHSNRTVLRSSLHDMPILFEKI